MQGADARLESLQLRLAQVAVSLRELDHRRGFITEERERRELSRDVISTLRAELTEAQAELDGLRIAMANRGVIERAKGMLMVRLGLDEPAAFEYLRSASNRFNRRVSEVATEVVDSRAEIVG